MAILGSTGSIGCNTLRVIDDFRDEFEVAALGAGANIDLLVDQIEQFHPRVVSVADALAADALLQQLRDRGVEAPAHIGTGVEGLVEVAICDGVDIVVGAVVGALGLLPTWRALQLGRRVALANKETLVIAGELMTAAAASSGAELLPVDSEHNALHQCLRGERRDEVKRVILTASGGPFRNSTREEIDQATPAAALRHPTWRMGAKITIDSATMMNKGLEVIEARWLFGCGPDQINVIVHPQSVIHSMVEMIDGSIIAQLGVTDMRHAIQYALTWPDRRPSTLPSLDLAELNRLEFFAPDFERFPCLRLAYEALRAGGTLPAVLNAANEVAVSAFLNEKIPFGRIAKLIEDTCGAHTSRPVTDLQTVLAADAWARDHVATILTAPDYNRPLSVPSRGHSPGTS